eukprot:gene7282-5236_t
MQSQSDFDLVDEEWEKDCLSDDELIIMNEVENAADANDDEEEAEEVKEDQWVDQGADRLILEALAGDQVQSGVASAFLNNAGGSALGNSDVPVSSSGSQYVPHLPSH